MKTILIILLIAMLCMCTTACGTNPPKPFESTGKPFIMKGCEDMKKRNPKANC